MGFALNEADLLRVCRDLAFSEIAAMPGFAAALGERIPAAPGERIPADPSASIDWSAQGLPLDSLARMQLATAAATWCNAYDAGFEDLFLAKRDAAQWATAMRRAREAGAQHITFASSGSTGVRKHIRHREDHLAQEAASWAGLLGNVKRVVVLAPTHHIYGFIWGVLLPKALAVPAVDANLTRLPALESGDLIVAVPDQWAWLASAQRAWPRGVQGISSTAPLPDAVHQALTRPVSGSANSPTNNTEPALAALWQIYGASETAGLAYRCAAPGSYTLAPDCQRNSAGGIDRVLPGGAAVPMAVQDELQWVDTRNFQLLRRSDHSVQIGGHNVSPDWVAAQLQSHAAVKAASVRLANNAAPAKLKAFVVLHHDDAAQRAALAQWALETLPWYASFSSISYGNALPLNALGKPSDWQESL